MYRNLVYLRPALSMLKTPATNGLSRTFFSRGSDPFSDMFKELDKMRREMNRVMDSYSFNFPLTPLSSRLRTIPVQMTNNETGLHTCKVGMKDYKPEDINVTVVGNTVTLKAKRSETEADGAKSHKELVYHYTLPDNVSLEGIRSRLESDGTLIIEAPVLKLESGQTKEIPVEVKNKT